MTKTFYKAFEDVEYPCFWLGKDGVFWANQFAQKQEEMAGEQADVRKLMAALIAGDNQPELLKATLQMRGLELLPHKDGLLAAWQQQSPKAVEAFSSGLREPVSDILSAVQALARRLETCNLKESDEAFFAECIESVQKNEYRLLRLAYNLEMYQMTGASQPCGQTVELSSFIENLCKRARNTFLKQGIELKTDITSKPLTLLIDSRMLGHAVGNLLRNCLQYTKEGNVVTVRLKAVAGRAVLTVEDKGLGIRPEAVQNVYEPFYSAFPHMDTPERPGLGLGLALVRGLARAQGGTVALESVFGEGSSVTLALPLAPPEELLLNSDASDYADFFGESQSPVYIQLSGFGPLPVM